MNFLYIPSRLDPLFEVLKKSPLERKNKLTPREDGSFSGSHRTSQPCPWISSRWHSGCCRSRAQRLCSVSSEHSTPWARRQDWGDARASERLRGLSCSLGITWGRCTHRHNTTTRSRPEQWSSSPSSARGSPRKDDAIDTTSPQSSRRTSARSGWRRNVVSAWTREGSRIVQSDRLWRSWR